MQEAIIELFFSLIRCGIGKERALPYAPTPDEWKELFDISIKQALTGIAFAGIERLPIEQHPPRRLKLQWYSACETIKQKNAEMNKKCIGVSRRFRQEGFDNCILKGQGIAQLYPNPLLRTPGDIDIWIDGNENKAIEFANKHLPGQRPTYHHIDFNITPNLNIEIHYRPSWTNNPFTNKRLQDFFFCQAKKQFENITGTPEGTFPAPTLAFNRIYILLHIYRHLFLEGIGMKQILDYYFVTTQSITPEEKADFVKTIKAFRLTKFTAALMYVMQQMFSLDEKHFILKPNARTGKFLLREIMIAGNFGQHDHRYDLRKQEYSLKRAIETTRRTATLLTHFPCETLWSPYFKLWHYFWRKRHFK